MIMSKKDFIFQVRFKCLQKKWLRRVIPGMAPKRRKGRNFPPHFSRTGGRDDVSSEQIPPIYIYIYIYYKIQTSLLPIGYCHLQCLEDALQGPPN